MSRTLPGRLAALALLLTLLLPAPALADSYPSGVMAEALGADTIRVSWGPNAWAQGYRVQRSSDLNVWEIIADLPPDVTECLDTGLEPLTVYSYRVASVVNGTEHWAAAVANAFTIAAPEGFTSATWYTVVNAQQQLWIRFYLAWTPVDGSVNFEVFARVGNDGEYVAQNIETCDTSTDYPAFPAPSVSTRYWFKVAVQTFITYPGALPLGIVYGPFSPEIYVDVPAQANLGTGPVWSTHKPPFFPASPIPVLPTPTATLTLPRPPRTPAPTRILRPQTSLTLITRVPVEPANPFFVIPTPKPVIIR